MESFDREIEEELELHEELKKLKRQSNRRQTPLIRSAMERNFTLYRLEGMKAQVRVLDFPDWDRGELFRIIDKRIVEIKALYKIKKEKLNG